jgi:predicted nucleic acid-binding protein
VLSATLDTSCALNFLGEDEQTSDALVDVVAAAIAGRVSVRVTDQAYQEVARTDDDAARSERLKRLRAFGRLELPAHRHGERDVLARTLHDVLFPGAQAGSRTDAHNKRDCLQLATHQLVGRDVFVTLDGALRRRARAQTTVPVDVIGPDELLDRLETEHRVGQLPSPPSIAVRDAAADEDEAAVREVLAPLTADYPDFSGWLTRALAKAAGGQARIRVGLVGGRVGAVVLSSRKDDRVMKLSAFFVAEWAREVGLAQHLLWSEIRTWAQAAIWGPGCYRSVGSRGSRYSEICSAAGGSMFASTATT